MEELKTYTVKVVLECEFTLKTALTPEEIEVDVSRKLEWAIENNLDGSTDIDGSSKCDVKVVEK